MEMNFRKPRAWKHCLALGLCLLALGVTGCSEEAEHVFEIAELEEKQHNYEHARQLYQRIIEIDPNGYFASKARERMAELDRRPAEQDGNRSAPPQSERRIE